MKSATVDTSPAAEHAAIAITKILVPTDFSSASEKAFSYALRFAQELGSQIALLHVLEPAAVSAFESLPPVCTEELKANAEENLRALVNSARAASVNRIGSTMRSGIAAHQIVEVAKELDVDLVVIATHGFTGWKHFAIGSTAERVARAAPCPVLVVREKEHDFL